MEELHGVISEDELMQYDGAALILLNSRNDDTGSGFSGSLEGTGAYRWSISWDQNGFTSQNWEAYSGIDLVQRYGSVEAVLERVNDDPVTYAISVATTNIDAYDAGCASAVLIN